MKKKTLRILAIVALVFMGLFTACFIAWCFNRALFNGAIGYAAIFTGGIGIGLFVVIQLLKRAQDKKAPEEGASASAPAEPQENEPDNKT